MATTVQVPASPPAEPDRRPPNCEACGERPRTPAMLSLQILVPNNQLLAGPNGNPIPPAIDMATLFRPPLLCPGCRDVLLELLRSVRALGDADAAVDVADPAGAPR